MYRKNTPIYVFDRYKVKETRPGKVISFQDWSNNSNLPIDNIIQNVIFYLIKIDLMIIIYIDIHKLNHNCITV